MKKYISLMRKAAIFSSFTDSEISSVCSCLDAKIKEYKKGECIFSSRESVDSLGIVLEGTVEICRNDFLGNRDLLGTAKNGDTFAESFACQKESKTNVSVWASDPSLILFLNVSNILSMCPNSCEAHKKIMVSLVGILAKKNLYLSEKLSHMAKRTTREKLISFLSSQKYKNGSEDFYISFSRQQLADYLGVDRSAMSWELCKMRDSGMLTFHKNHFVLKSIVDFHRDGN